MKVQDILSSYEAFRTLKPDQINTIASLFKPFKISKGQTLAKHGERHSSVYMLFSGNVSVYSHHGSDQHKINDIKAPCLVGFTCLFITNAIATATLIADYDSDGFIADRSAFETLVIQDPELSALQDAATLSSQKKSKIVVFDSKPYDILYFNKHAENYNDLGLELDFVESRLSEKTVSLAQGATVVSVFVNDTVNAQVVQMLTGYGVKLIALRCAGFNNVDLNACDMLGMSVARVPAYSPYAVAEHALALMLSLNRKTHHAYTRTRNGDFTLSNSLIGFDMHGRTVGVIGTGKIGKILVNILIGLGCNVLCYDVYRDEELCHKQNVRYVDTVDEIYTSCDVISLHSPLLPDTKHMINDDAISKMKKGVMLINTSRGGLIDTMALIRGLKSGMVGSAGLDVYEGEEEYFFRNWSDHVINDDLLARLMTFNNVLVTSHQAFFTKEALDAISSTTYLNVEEFVKGGKKMKQLTNTVNKSA
ncbi:hypothetical protein ROZALSC1DRAFT_29799 [Rozella allomycis CSF55]|uniref:Cyclic nucleotide-binding domain-containing protein n=1 Tax=Rozella allomycis (strain CSF55) TaxID=988480 RepID=A0A4P9YGB0_ROZAC|nr:hypothetical protein ROZALSC1DRAFT_29799 [Rozella allomycis CSF55]